MKDKFNTVNQFCDDMILGLGRTGIISVNNAKLHFNVGSNDISVLNNKKLIEKEKMYSLNYGLKRYLKLTQKGYLYVKHNLGLKYMYITSSSQVLHDLKLNEFYCSLDYKIRNTWVTETEMHLDILNKKQESLNILGSIDGAYRDGNELVGVEVITRNYNSNEIQQKQVIAEIIGCSKLILIKV